VLLLSLGAGTLSLLAITDHAPSDSRDTANPPKVPESTGLSAPERTAALRAAGTVA